MKKKDIVSSILMLCVLAAFSIFMIKEYKKINANETEQIEQLTDTSFTTESSTSEDASATTEETEFSTKIDAELMDTFLEGKDVGFAYYNFDNQDYYSNNGDQEYTAASTVKVGIAMMMADLIDQGEFQLSDKVTYTEDDYEAGSGSLQYEELGSEYTIEELITKMITESDNVATQMLLRTATRDVYQEYMNEYIGATFNMSDNTLSANEGLNLLKELYNNPSNIPGYEQIIDLMKQTIYDDRMSTYIEDENIAHKIGDYGSIGIANDLAIIYGDNNVAASFYCQNGQSICYEYAAEIGKYIYELITEDKVYDTQSKVETNEAITYETISE